MKYFIFVLLGFFPAVSFIDTTVWLFTGDRAIVVGESGEELMLRVVVLTLLSVFTGGILMSLLADMIYAHNKAKGN